jgi:glycosyltransferase involved in cell wall biosynthesis
MTPGKPRIAILADFPVTSLTRGASGRGGGQGCTWLPQLAQCFQAANDLEINWISFRRGKWRGDRIDALGQSFHGIPAVPFSVDLALSYLPARVGIAAALRRIKPHIVHAWGTELVYPAALADFKGPRILSMQGVLSAYEKIGGLDGNWQWRRMLASEQQFIRSATIVTSESQWGIDRVREIVPDADCRMVEYGVHPSFYDLKWQPDPLKPYALFIGGSGHRKGFDLLLDALKQIPDRSWEMRLAGDASMEERCAATGLPGLKCLGLLNWSELQHQLQGAWCSVLPTRADTSPNSVKEARVVGLPVVTSIHGGQSGYIRDGENGYIAEPLDATRLADTLSRAMVSFENTLRAGNSRHAEDREYLHPSRTAQSFIAIYRELAAKVLEHGT